MNATRSTSPRRRWGWSLAAIVATALVVRGCVFDVYKIDSGSMSPSLLEGDRLLVIQSGVDAREFERWDVVVTDSSIDAEVPEGTDAVIKRVAAMAGESVLVSGGDLFIGGSGGELSLVRKPDDLVARLLVPMHDAPGLQPPWAPSGVEDWTQVAEGTRLSAPSGAVYEDVVHDGIPGVEGREAVGDTALAIEFGAGGGVFRMSLREGGDVFEARLASAADGGATLHRNTRGAGVVASDAEFAGIREGQRVLMWNVDNGVRVIVDGRTVLSYDHERDEPGATGGSERNAPALAVESGAWVVRRATVLRDLHYAAQGSYAVDPESGLAPFRVPPGHLFLLGDLSVQSRDSRFFGPVPESKVRGRPVMIYMPASRAGWLPAGP